MKKSTLLNEILTASDSIHGLHEYDALVKMVVNSNSRKVRELCGILLANDFAYPDASYIWNHFNDLHSEIPVNVARSFYKELCEAIA